MSYAVGPNAQWAGYRNEAKFQREMTTCRCGRMKRRTSARCEHCAARVKSARALAVRR